MFVHKEVFCVYLLIRVIRAIRVRFLFRALLNIRVIRAIRVRIIHRVLLTLNNPYK